MIPLPEWVPDQPSLNSGLQVAQNCYWYAGGYRSLPTLSAVSTAFTGAPRGVGSFHDLNGLANTYVGTATKIWQRNAGTWTDVTNTTPPSLSSDDRWEFNQWGNDAYAASRSSVLQRQASGSGAFANVTSGPQGNCIGRVNQFMVLGDLYEGGANVPNRVHWSAIGDPTTWPALGSAAAQAVQSDYQDLDKRDGTVTAIRGWEFGLVFQERAITRMTYIGSPIIFQFDKIDSRGSQFPGSVVQVGRRVYFLGDDGWYVTDGAGEAQAIGRGRVDRWFFDNCNLANGSQISGAHDPSRGLILWAFPSANGSGSNDSMLVYNYKDDKWTSAAYSADYLYLGYPPGYNVDNVDSIFPSVDTTNISVDASFWNQSRGTLSGLSANCVVQLEGGSGTATITLNDAVINEGQFSVLKSVKPHSDGTVTVSASGRRLFNDSLVWVGPFATRPENGKATMRVGGFYHRVQLNIAGTFSKATAIEFEAVAAGAK